jgi:uncharacterized protein YeaO (DUF488 family)
MIRVKRVYEPASRDDGYRILVDALWPRGLTKEKAAADVWVRDIAPTKELRDWFGHDPEKWEEFQKRYWKELDANKEAVEKLRDLIDQHKNVTILFGTKEERYNNAIALREYLEKHGA